jgi:hypothetical protein
MGIKLAFNLRGQGKWGKEGPLEGFALGPKIYPALSKRGMGYLYFKQLSK